MPLDFLVIFGSVRRDRSVQRLANYVYGTISTLVNTAGKKGSSGNGGPAAAADLNTPFAVAVDPSTEDIYIADTSNNKVRVVTGFAVPTTTAGGPVAPTPPTPPKHPHH